MTKQPDHGGWLLAIAVVAVGLNLRGAIVAVAPVLADIQDGLQISAERAGLLTTIPVLCFAAVSPLVAVFARRIGVNAAVAVSFTVMAFAIAIRPWWGFGLMLAGTLFIGASVAVGNVLLPVVIRRDFPARPGPMLSAFTSSTLLSATISAVVMVPLASVLGWRAALAAWAIPTVVALMCWLAATSRRGDPDAANITSPVVTPTGRASSSAWRKPAAWELGVYFGLQSFLFYAATAWLPTILREEGSLDATAAGAALSLFQLLGVAGAVVVPVLIRRRTVRLLVPAALGALWVAFFAGVLLAPAGWAVWCVLGGITQGGCLALGFSLIAVRSTSSDAARGLSAMVQTVAYCIAGLGPVAVGTLSSLDGWTMPMMVLIVLGAVCGAAGLRASASRPII